MASLLPVRLVPVGCDRLQVGMYVAELDRPWLQTPFHSQGFVVRQPEQLDELRRLCEYVYVDPVLSEHGDPDLFATGLTSRVRTLETPEPLSPIDRGRVDLRTLGHAFAAALRNARLSGQLAVAPLRRALEPIVTLLMEDTDTVNWLVATELRVGLVHRRALGSAVLMAGAGHRLGFARHVLDDLALAGLLLDIGKISVPITILAKPVPLTEHERGFIYRHVRRGLYLIRAAALPSPHLEDAVLGHHERLDGSGYPRGLRGTQIPLAARVAAIVDTYDALLQERHYAPALAAHDAARLIASQGGAKFDAALVRSFIRGIGIYPTGSWVQLADGRLGIVRRQTEDEPARPGIALVSDSAGRELHSLPALWRPIRRGDIARPIRPAELRLERRVVDSALAAANLAA